MKKELIGSTIAHVLLALFLFAMSARGKALPPPVDLDDVMTVTPVDALPPGILAAPEADIPSPADDADVEEPVSIPEKAPEAIPVEPKPKPPEEKPKPKPKEPAKKPEPKPKEPPKEEPKPSGQTGEGQYESTVQAGGQQGGSLLGLKGGTPGARAATYPDRVANKAYYMWRNPAKMQETIKCSIVFRIDRDGKASQIALANSSGLPAFDNSAVRAVYQATPFPPFPRSMKEEYIMMTIHFVYTP